MGSELLLDFPANMKVKLAGLLNRNQCIFIKRWNVSFWLHIKLQKYKLSYIFYGTSKPKISIYAL